MNFSFANRLFIKSIILETTEASWLDIMADMVETV